MLLLFVAVSWIAASPARRAATSFGRIAVTFLAVALLSASAWFGGELVYAHGTGVMTEVGVTAGSVGQPEWLRANLPPLQVHLLGGGFLAALLLLALAQSLRFWREDRDRREVELAPGAPTTGTVVTHSHGIAQEDLFAAEPVIAADAQQVRRPSAAAVRGLWAASLIGGVAVASGGLWSMLGSLSTDRLERFWASLGDDPRVFAHFVVGASLVLLPLLPLAMPRFLGRSSFVAGSMVLGFSVLLAAQVWVGALMLYDGHAGPLTGLADAPTDSRVAPDARPGEFTDPDPRARPIEAGAPRDPARDGE